MMSQHMLEQLLDRISETILAKDVRNMLPDMLK